MKDRHWDSSAAESTETSDHRVETRSRTLDTTVTLKELDSGFGVGILRYPLASVPRPQLTQNKVPGRRLRYPLAFRLIGRHATAVLRRGRAPAEIR